MASNLHNAQGSGSSGGSVLDSLGLSLFQEKRFLRPLLVGMSLMLFQQVSHWGNVGVRVGVRVGALLGALLGALVVVGRGGCQ
jgi:hypothetical protein